jgi:hypothetical protein
MRQARHLPPARRAESDEAPSGTGEPQLTRGRIGDRANSAGYVVPFERLSRFREGIETGRGPYPDGPVGALVDGPYGIRRQCVWCIRLVTEARETARAGIEPADAAPFGSHPETPECVFEERADTVVCQAPWLVGVVSKMLEHARGGVDAIEAATPSAGPDRATTVGEHRPDVLRRDRVLLRGRTPIGHEVLAIPAVEAAAGRDPNEARRVLRHIEDLGVAQSVVGRDATE